MMSVVLGVFRQAILSSMPRRSVIAASPFASQSVEIGEYYFVLCCTVVVHLM